MSRYLSVLLSAKEPQFTQLIAKLEDAAAGVGVDVRFSAEIRVAVAEKIRELGLDPQDTTTKELYHALLARAAQDDELLQKAIGIKVGSDSVLMIQKIARYFAASTHVPQVWSLKRIALKKLLTTHPPTKTMKVLHYRSAASMLKRESPAVVYAVSLLVEGARYKQSLIGSIKHLSSSDFELSKVECIPFTPERWADIKKYLKVPVVPVFSVPEANALVIVPAKTTKTKGLTLLVSALLLHELRRLKEHGSYMKFRSLDSGLHTHVKSLALKGSIHVTTLHDQPIYWHHVHRFLSRSPDERSYLEPHVHKDDLEWTALEASLAGIDTRLAFWIGTHVLGYADESGVQSLHIIDVCMNLLYERSAAHAGKRFLQDAVWDELLIRYMEVPPFSGIIERHMYKISDNGNEFMYDGA